MVQVSDAGAGRGGDKKKMARFWRYSEDGDWMSSPREKMSTREEAQGHLEF